MESVVIPFCCLEEARVAARCYGITLQSTPSKWDGYFEFLAYCHTKITSVKEYTCMLHSTE